MSYIVMNLGPILAATAVGLFIGLLYMVAVRRPGGRVWVLAIVAILAEMWLASILAGALILAPRQANPWVMAVGSAVIIWIGFVLPSLVVSYGFRGQRAAATAVDVLHWLVVMVAQAAVLQAVGLVRP